MTYRIRVTERAKTDILELIDYVATVKQEPLKAGRLLEAIYKGIDSLQTMPGRCAVAPESRLVDRVVRMLIVKRTLLVLFTINDDDLVVTVQGFRHGSRQPLDLGGEL